MSVEIIFEEDDKGVLVICPELVTGEELIEANYILIPKLEVRYQIWDFSLSKNIQVEIEQIHTAAIQDNSFPMDSSLTHIAFVGDINKWKHLYDAYESMSEIWVGRRVKFSSSVFSDIDEARAWIGLDV